ncbi:MAG: hypothetical protein HRT57_00810 [Crocinitomicaceae bacterium]|nr:hypothetical protein [Crocinitomicaceae bacterium]
MKKSIIIVAVSAFYLMSCGNSTDDHSHSDDEGGHSHEENDEHHDHNGHGHDHDHDIHGQEDFVVDSIQEEDEGPNDSRHPMDSEIETYCHVHGKYHDNGKIHKEEENDPDVHGHDHDGHDHDHGDHKH